MVEVINLNHIHDFGNPGDVLCNRSTKWGNPFIMYYQPQRDEVCDKFEKYFELMETIRDREKLVEALVWTLDMDRSEAQKWVIKTGGHLDIKELKDAKRLGCHCFPRHCHCDYLKKRIEALKEPEDWKWE